MPDFYPFPQAVAKHVGRCSNFGLSFDRFASYPVLDATIAWNRKVGRKDKKSELWQSIKSNIRRTLAASKDAHRSEMERRARYIQANDTVLPVQLSLRSRLAIGLGGSNVMENGITLHRIFGFPIIPGSAIKGVCAHWLFCKIAEDLQLPMLESHVLQANEEYKSPWAKLDKLLTENIDWTPSEYDLRGDRIPDPVSHYKKLIDEKVIDYRRSNQLQTPDETEMTQRLANHHQQYQNLFGSPSRRGKVTFGDAFPTQLFLNPDNDERPILEIDLVNPHYGEYYGKNGIPSDDDKPVISNFLTVAAGTEFQFFIEASDKNLREKARDVLIASATESGIGAKTYANYGCFQH
jgi:CRISPR-associated protein Cmr6